MAKAQKPPKPPHNGGGGGTGIPAPTGLTVVSTVNGVYIQWNPVAGATSYWIYRDQYVPAIIQATNFTDTTVPPGTHVYAVAAVVNSTLGPKSNSVSITV